MARNWHKAAPLLRKYGFPSTLYVTTRDVLSKAPVFDVALRYLLWKKRNETLDLCSIGLDPETIVLSTTDERESVACRISEISKNWDDHNKQVILLKLAETLGIDLNSDGDSLLFRLMTMEKLAQLPLWRMDLQLHTHRHCLPIGDPEDVKSEIIDNRTVLKRIAVDNFSIFAIPAANSIPCSFPG